MKGYLVEGGARLEGEVTVAGAKNSALPIMAASILTPHTVTLDNIPSLRDVDTFISLLGILGLEVADQRPKLTLSAGTLKKQEAPYDLVKKMRASILVLGPLLARVGEARVSLPGGCAIGERPVDQHLKALRAMGAEIEIKHGYIEARSRRLKGARIYLDVSTVTGTENLMMAAVLAEGETVIENAAREPEVMDLAGALSAMGASIEGAGEDTIFIRGVRKLGPLDYRIMPDRIEGATYLAAGMITGGRITIRDTQPQHLEAVVMKMREAGGRISSGTDHLKVTGPSRPRAVDVKTMPYPGYPTDMQAQMMALMAVSRGLSVITETVFENRFMHAAELSRMGAEISIQGHSAIIRGSDRLSGAPVMATDLRAGASLVLAALVAEGYTEIARVYHLERGYEDLVGKMSRLGASIREKDLG
jgi:UDP-N-acetylglucosamine 1-carboxyvinyltransferase